MYKHGTIVLVPFPFTDLSAAKVRPALIVSRKVSGSDLVLVFISSKIGRRRSDKFDVKVTPDKRNNLKTVSAIKCAKVATLDKKIILGELGTLDNVDQVKVNKKLKNLLAL